MEYISNQIKLKYKNMYLIKVTSLVKFSVLYYFYRFIINDTVFFLIDINKYLLLWLKLNKFFLFIDYCIIEQYNRIHCPKNCGRSYKGDSRKKNLRRHLLFECGVEPQFQCSFCPKQFRRNSTMKSHVAIIHNTIL